MIRVYPERNPFPRQASSTIDGVGAQAGTAERTQRAASFPTLLLPSVRQLRESIERYFSQYRPAEKGRGLPVALRGDHGTGKTHAIRYIMSLVSSGELRPAVGVLQPYQLYTRAETTDFMDIYRQLMRQVPLAVLRDLTLRFLGVVGSKIYGESLASERVEERAVQMVIQNPEIVSQAFREYLVGEGEAKSRQAAEIESVFGKGENFHNVIGYLLRDDLAETAYRWLIGEEVSQEDRKKLGVSATIQTPAIARWGIRFLATVFGRGGRPLIIYVDQYEKLLLGLDGTMIPENAGLMRALVDEIRVESGMIVFGGNVEAWQAVSQVRDLRQRFGTNLIEFPVLTYDDATRLIRLYLSMGRNHLLEVWSLEGGGETIRLRGHALPIRAIAVTRDGRLAVSASKDSTVKIWDLDKQENLRTLHGHQGAVNAVALTPDQKRVVSGGDDHTVRVWDLESGRELFTLAGHENWVNAVVVTPDGGRTFSGSSDLTIRGWDLGSGKEIQILRGHRDTVWSLAVTPDGKTLVSASSDGTLRVWNLASGDLLETLSGHNAWVNAVITAPDGQRAVSASDDMTLRLWDLQSGQALLTLAGHTAPVRALRFVPGGERLVSAAIDNTYKIWDLKSGSLPTTIQRPTDDICAFMLVPRDSGRVVSARSEEYQEGADEGIFPFEPGAVRTVLRNGGGNVRRLLQMCADAFELAFPKQTPINEHLVETVLRKDHGITVDRNRVIREIEKIMAEQSLRFSRSYKVDHTLVDFAVLAPDNVPRLLVQLTEALFLKDEADQALSSVNLIDRVRRYNLPAQVVLVVVGYASPEVTDLLRTVAHEAIVYEPENFTARFGDVLNRMKSSLSATSGAGKEIDGLKKDLNAVKEALERIAVTRGQETRSLEEQLSRFFQLQAVDRAEKQHEDARSAWFQERKQIEERIREVRKNQKKADLEELERLRKKAEDEQRQQRIVRSAIAGIMGFALGSVLPLVIYGGFMLELLPYSLVLGVFVMVILAAVAFMPQFLGPRRLRDLASEVGSVEELDRLAKAALPQERESFNKERFAKMLHNSNPHLRYAGVLVVNGEEDAPLLVNALGSERSTLVRRLIARRLGQSGIDLGQIVREASFKSTPEMVYLVEVAAEVGRPDLLHLLAGQRSPLYTLAVIAARSSGDLKRLLEGALTSPSLALELAASQFPGLSISYRLSAAFQSGLNGDLSHLADLSEMDIQNALRELSPFEEGGLGTFDDLNSIARIDQYYLFFRQLAFYKGRGLLVAGEEK